MKLTRLFHSFFNISEGAHNILIDPAIDFEFEFWLTRETTYPDPAGYFVNADAIVLSHAHSDHYHIPSLLSVDRSVPIFVPDVDWETPLPIAEELVVMGFQHIYRLKTWEPVAIGTLHVIGIPAKASVEGTPQISVAVFCEDHGNVFYDAVDTLEDKNILRQINENFSAVDVAALPVGCSFNFLNVRNQMSPSVAAQVLDLLRPRFFIPTGLNTAPVRYVSTDFPMFPFDNSLLELRSFVSTIPSGCSIACIDPGTTLNLTNTQEEAWVGRTLVESSFYATGRLASALIRRNVRDTEYFGIPATRNVQQWVTGIKRIFRDFGSEKAWSQSLEDIVRRVPPTWIVTPLNMYFPRTMEALLGDTAAYDDFAVALVNDLVHSNVEFSGVSMIQHCLSFIQMWFSASQFVCEMALLEAIQELQMVHQSNVPSFKDATWEKAFQIYLDHLTFYLDESPQHIFPRFNPLFGPVTVMKSTVLSFIGQSTKVEGGDLQYLAFISPSYFDDKPVSLHIMSIKKQEEIRLIEEIRRSRGRMSLEQIVQEHGRSLFTKFAKKLFRFTPFSLEYHWLPEAGYADDDWYTSVGL
ncbi:MBL fold metallo-hydrolase [Sulfobacillus sp. hq2]|uniref:MBL fold metallo-hydrolase n=1 Tax=Sulfobacillus TaxID=28033 RepID=UPI000CD1BED8|nr:MBL fold metallo-hydrolase [Sulfobacillus sp. hq2]POB11053.1 hypothetical protein CO251_05745 [Sulfobacillus sp. hq2]